MNFGSNVFDKSDANALSVEIAAEVEDMRLQQRACAADSGPRAEIGGRVVPFDFATSIDPDAYRVYSKRRTNVITQDKIGSAKADRASYLVALYDPSLNLERAPQQRCGVTWLTARQVIADNCRRIDNGVRGCNRLDRREFEIFCRRFCREEFRIAATVATKGKIVSNHDVFRA